MRMLAVTIAFIAAAAVGCGTDNKSPTGSVPPTSPTLIRLHSDSGDYVGGGGSYEYTQANAVIGVNAAGGYLHVGIHGDQEFYGYFMSPTTNTRLVPGTYPVQKYPFSDATTGGLAWVGPGASQCTTVRGSFTIDSAAYIDTTLTQVDARFDEYCENFTGGLHGQIHWAAADTTRPPGPVYPVPTGLWVPAPGTTPVTGNYVYLVSDSADYLGGGQTYTLTNGIGLTSGGDSLSVTTGTSWDGEFTAMSSIAKPRAGYYTGLRPYPYGNPAKGEFRWMGDGRACPYAVSWVVVDQIAYAVDGVTALDMRFELQCSNGAPAALHGAIHWIR